MLATSFTLEDAARVQEIAKRLQMMADLIKQRLGSVENAESAVVSRDAAAASDALDLDLDVAIEHLRELSLRGFGRLAEQPAVSVPAPPAVEASGRLAGDADW